MKSSILRILLLSLLAAFPPLSTDMYLAAIPMLVKQWQQPLVLVNLTLVCFFITYCCCLLVYGPLSDKYGRRPPLLIGIGLFITSCLVCASAQSVEMLILGRILQGAGAAAASSIVFAICKDVYSGADRQRVFIQIGIIVAAAPVIAPIIGAWVIDLLSWRWIFLLQGVMAVIALSGVYRLQESLVDKRDDGILYAFFSYGQLLRNAKYVVLLMALSVYGMPVFAFIAGSSDLYMTQMGYDEHAFSYFFGVNALAFVFAPISFSYLSRRYNPAWMIPISFAGMIGSALFFLLSSIPLPWRLTGPMFFVTFFFSFCRPGGSNLVLEQVDRNAGAASSLMVFSYFFTGAVAMWFFSWEWSDKLFTLSMLTCIPVSIALLLWGIWFWLEGKLPPLR